MRRTVDRTSGERTAGRPVRRGAGLPARRRARRRAGVGVVARRRHATGRCGRTRAARCSTPCRPPAAPRSGRRVTRGGDHDDLAGRRRRRCPPRTTPRWRWSWCRRDGGARTAQRTATAPRARPGCSRSTGRCRPGTGDNQALAVNTTDGSVAYDVSFSLVWADGDDRAEHERGLRVRQLHRLPHGGGRLPGRPAGRLGATSSCRRTSPPRSTTAACECVTLRAGDPAGASACRCRSASRQPAQLAAVWAELQAFGRSIEDVPAGRAAAPGSPSSSSASRPSCNRKGRRSASRPRRVRTRPAARRPAARRPAARRAPARRPAARRAPPRPGALRPGACRPGPPAGGARWVSSPRTAGPPTTGRPPHRRPRCRRPRRRHPPRPPRPPRLRTRPEPGRRPGPRLGADEPIAALIPKYPHGLPRGISGGGGPHPVLHL